MKAIQVERFGAPSELRLADVPKPQPGPGEVLVKLACAGVNYIDVYMRNGSYARSHTYKTPLPMVIGVVMRVVACPSQFSTTFEMRALRRR